MVRAARTLLTVAAFAALALLVLAVGGRIPAGDQAQGPLAEPALQVAVRLRDISVALEDQAKNFSAGEDPALWRQILVQPAKIVISEAGRVAGVLGQVISPAAEPPASRPAPAPCCPPKSS